MRFSFKAVATPLAASLVGILFPSYVDAATVGTPTNVNFSPVILDEYCNLSVTDGALAYANVLGIDYITSNPFRQGTPANLNVTSNLNGSGIVVVDQPSLTGNDTPESYAVGSPLTGTAASDSSSLARIAMNLNQDGSLSTQVWVEFENFTRKFKSGTYNASAVITCTNNGVK